MALPKAVLKSLRMCRQLSVMSPPTALRPQLPRPPPCPLPLLVKGSFQEVPRIRQAVSRTDDGAVVLLHANEHGGFVERQSPNPQTCHVLKDWDVREVGPGNPPPASDPQGVQGPTLGDTGPGEGLGVLGAEAGPPSPATWGEGLLFPLASSARLFESL